MLDISLKDFFPSDHRTKEMEKKALDEWKKLLGMSELNAKFRYLQLAFSLKTYGMTCFKVKEQVSGEKKLKDMLFCMSRNALIRIDPQTNVRWGLYDREFDTVC